MSLPSKILIATDLSPASERAVCYGFELARALHAEVVLLYAYAFPGPPHPGSFYATASQAIYDQAIADLTQVAKGYPDVITHSVVCWGHAKGAILEAARNVGADLIVTGSHHSKGVERLLVGGVGETVGRKASCPVVMVPRATA